VKATPGDEEVASLILFVRKQVWGWPSKIAFKTAVRRNYDN
jgi:hypothetical protein